MCPWFSFIKLYFRLWQKFIRCHFYKKYSGFCSCVLTFMTVSWWPVLCFCQLWVSSLTLFVSLLFWLILCIKHLFIALLKLLLQHKQWICILWFCFCSDTHITKQFPGSLVYQLCVFLLCTGQFPYFVFFQLCFLFLWNLSPNKYMKYPYKGKPALWN